MREANKKVADLEDMIRVAQQKVAASRRKLEDVQRMSSTSEITLTVALRADLERATASMSAVRPLRCTGLLDCFGGNGMLARLCVESHMQLLKMALRPPHTFPHRFG